jgi:hypothetical protein
MACWRGGLPLSCFATTSQRNYCGKTGNLKIVQWALNHAEIQSTARYAHVGDKELAEALETLHESRNTSRNKVRTKHGVSCCQLSPGKFLSDPTSPGGTKGRAERARRTNALAAALAFRRFSPTRRNETLTRSHDCASFAVLTLYRVLQFKYFLITQKRRGGLIMLGLLAQ